VTANGILLPLRSKDAVFGSDSIRESAFGAARRPRQMRNKNKISAEYGQSGAAAILNGQALPLAQKRQMRYTINTTTAPVFR